jgi:hypothetical protein
MQAVFGSVLSAVAVAIAAAVWPKHGLNADFVVSSGFFPLIVSIALLISAVCLVLKGYRNQRFDERVSINNPALIVAMLAAAAAYTSLLPILGYAIATVGFVAGTMFLLGARTWRLTILLPVLLSLTLYFLLDRLAGLPLPSGTMFQ